MEILQMLQCRISELQEKIVSIEKLMSERDLSERERVKHNKVIRELKETLNSNKNLLMTISPAETGLLH